MHFIRKQGMSCIYFIDDSLINMNQVFDRCLENTNTMVKKKTLMILVWELMQKVCFGSNKIQIFLGLILDTVFFGLILDTVFFGLILNTVFFGLILDTVFFGLSLDTVFFGFILDTVFFGLIRHRIILYLKKHEHKWIGKLKHSFHRVFTLQHQFCFSICTPWEIIQQTQRENLKTRDYYMRSSGWRISSVFRWPGI